MLKFTQTLFLFLLFSFQLQAQGSNNNNIEPVLDCPTDLTVCLNETLGPYTLATTSDLPNIEYAIIDHNLPAPSGTGDAIVGIDEDGIFMPSEYNLTPGTSFGVIPVAYDLNSVRGTLDDILKGSVTIFFVTTPCCDLAASQGSTVCADLNAQGIFCGSDVTSLGAVSTLSGTTDTLSIADFVAEIDAVNTQLADPLLPAECGGGDFIAYAYGPECTYFLVADTLNITMPHVINELNEATDLVTSNTIVDASFVVEYNANICIELQPGFETVIGADFTAAIDDPCN